MSEYDVYLVDGRGERIGRWGGSINAKSKKQAVKRFKILAYATTAGIAWVIVKAKRGIWKAKVNIA